MYVLSVNHWGITLMDAEACPHQLRLRLPLVKVVMSWLSLFQ